MLHFVIVGVGGFLGSVLRYWSSNTVQPWTYRDFPIGTLLVNAIGCLLVGAFWSLIEHRGSFSQEQRIFVTVGILGGFTTFSVFGYETFKLLRDGEYLLAFTNISAHVIIGVAAVTVGWMTAKALAQVN